MKLPHKIGQSLMIVSKDLRRYFDRQTNTDSTPGMTGVQAFALRWIYFRQKDGYKTYQKDLEYEFGVSRSTASETLRVMEQAGMIRRVPVPQDARRKELVLTAQYLAILEQIAQRMDAAERTISELFTEEELDCLWRILDKLESAITVAACPGKDD